MEIHAEWNPDVDTLQRWLTHHNDLTIWLGEFIITVAGIHIPCGGVLILVCGPSTGGVKFRFSGLLPDCGV